METKGRGANVSRPQGDLGNAPLEHRRQIITSAECQMLRLRDNTSEATAKDLEIGRCLTLPGVPWSTPSKPP